MASRQRTGFVESLLCLISPDWDVPDFSTLSRRRTTLAVNILHRRSQAPLRLLIDSTAIKVAVEGEKERNARKHAGPKCRAWRKVHLGISDQTLEIRAVEVTSGDVGDVSVLPELLSQIPARFQPIRTSPALLPTRPATRASATIPLQNEVLHEAPNDVLHGVLHEALPPSFHPARTGNSARPSPQVQLRATRHCGYREYLDRALWRR